MNVTTSMLECIVAIADEQGLGNAARLMGVSQPTMSTTLKNVETELGITLFHRTGNALALTPEGAAVLPLARQAVIDHRTLERLVDGLREGRSGPMTLAVTVGVSYGLVMPDLVLSFTESRPEARIDIVPIVDPAEAIDAVRTGLVETAIVLDGDAPDDLEQEWLSDQVLVLALPPKLGPIADFAELASTGPLRMVTSARTIGGDEALVALQNSSIEPRIVLSGIPLNALPGLVAGGVGAAIMTEPMSRPVVAAGGTALPLEPPLLARATLVYSARYIPPLLASFLEQLHGGDAAAVHNSGAV
ncbi:LysR family transcriptional regulator [Rhodococcus fascians]|nr:LysR family transcriptional regulator [Rhodococcus fascians]